MLLSNAPRKVALPFAENGEKNTIPESSSPSPGRASMNDGFPPLTRQPVGSGGIPPQGLDMNGIFYYLSSLNKWQSAGGSFVYDSTFANDSDVGGYPKGAVLLRSGGDGFWLNLADNNVNNPDTGGANWQPINNVGITSKTLTGSDVTLTNSEAAKDIIVLSGTLTANVNLIVPVFVKQWIVANNTTGAFTVTVKTASGTGGLVTQSTNRVFYGDGTNIYGVNPLIASQAQVNTGTDNSTFLTPKTFKDSQLLADKADKNGNTSNRFKIAAAVDSDESVRKDQLPLAATQAQVNTGTDTLTFLTPKTFKDSQLLADKADKNGDAAETFNVANGTSGSHAVNKSQLDAVAAANFTSLAIVNLIYPVGIVVDFSVNTNPNAIWVGTIWERFAEGRTTIGYKSGDADFGTIGGTGGAKGSTLSTDNLPEFNLKLKIYPTNVDSGIDVNQNIDIPMNYSSTPPSGAIGPASLLETSSIGQAGPDPIPTLPPYIVTAKWVRTL